MRIFALHYKMDDPDEFYDEGYIPTETFILSSLGLNFLLAVLNVGYRCFPHNKRVVFKHLRKGITFLTSV